MALFQLVLLKYLAFCELGVKWELTLKNIWKEAINRQTERTQMLLVNVGEPEMKVQGMSHNCS